MTNRDRRALRRSLCRSAFEAVEGRLITESLVYPEVWIDPEVRVKGSDKVWKGPEVEEERLAVFHQIMDAIGEISK